jgi:3-oxoacyl-[acyl-carrier protein] reductase
VNISLVGKTALVTGATGELGRTIALSLAASGANVIVHYHRAAEAAERLRGQIESLGVKACTLGGDLTSPQFFAALATGQAATLPPVDLLILNAVVQYKWVTVLDQPVEDYMSQFESSALQCVRLAKVFVPGMIQRRHGRIVAINTECAMQCNERSSAYIAGKRALDGVVRVLAREVGSHGITVNQVAPGWIVSDNRHDDTSALNIEYKQRVPLRHRGVPADIAHAVVFLCSEQARFISGCYLPVCGGNVMPAI